MIIVQRIWKDFLIHYLIIFILAAFLKKPLNLGYGKFLYGTVIITFLVTYLNHRIFPQLNVNRYLNVSQEGFQACNLRWGNVVGDCPYKNICQQRRMCEYNQMR
jgi:hypothetical protein